ncbi:MAG: hypothetical protein JSS87_12375 [Acidobacteria bacterium]|nr:hypothetical protein [Acidobacteriota bacterium]
MTNIQLLLSIGIPSLLICLAWIQTNGRLGRVETTVDTINHDQKSFYRLIGTIEGRVDELSRR